MITISEFGKVTCDWCERDGGEPLQLLREHYDQLAPDIQAEFDALVKGGPDSLFAKCIDECGMVAHEECAPSLSADPDRECDHKWLPMRYCDAFDTDALEYLARALTDRVAEAPNYEAWIERSAELFGDLPLREEGLIATDEIYVALDRADRETSAKQAAQ